MGNLFELVFFKAEIDKKKNSFNDLLYVLIYSGFSLIYANLNTVIFNGLCIIEKFFFWLNYLNEKYDALI